MKTTSTTLALWLCAAGVGFGATFEVKTNLGYAGGIANRTLGNRVGGAFPAERIRILPAADPGMQNSALESSTVGKKTSAGFVSTTATMPGRNLPGFSLAAEGTGAPAVRSLSTAAGPVGSSVTIAGTNFSAVGSNNVVWFGGVRAQVISASATQLVVLVPPGAGYAPISVTTGGLTAHSAIPFAVTFSSWGGFEPTSFSAPAGLAFATSLAATALADVDGDGRLDLVVANQGSGAVRVFRNQGMIGALESNSFAAPLTLSAGALPNSVVTADIDGDGRLDVVTAGSSAPLLSVLHNTSAPGGIAFAAALTYPLDGTAHSGLAIADFDGDGRPDVATANSGTNTVSVVQNLSTPGTILFASAVNLPLGVTPIRLAVGDLDGDGHPDIVAASAGGARLAVLRNLGIGGVLTSNSFSPKFDLASLSAPYDVAVGDLDGDGRPDLAAAISQNLVSVWRNVSVPGSLAPGSFAPRVDFPVAASVNAAGFPWTVGIADLNGDAKPELFTANYKTNFVSVLRNMAALGSLDTNSFAPWVGITTAFGPFHAVAGDLDGDSRPDLVTANTPGNTVSLLRNTMSPGCVASAPGLVAWWRGDGDGRDAIGLFGASLSGDVMFAPGLVGQAFSFNGTPTHQPWAFRVAVPAHPSLSPHANDTGETGLAPDARSVGELSVEAWIRIPSLPTGQVNENDPIRYAVRKLSASGCEYGLFIATNGQAGFVVCRYGGEAFGARGGDVTPNQWHHLVGTYKKNTFVRIYLDGVQVSELASPSFSGSVTTSDFVIGHEGLFNGLIDEVALFRRALSGAEIQAAYAAGAAGRCPPVRFDVGTLGAGGVTLSPSQPAYLIGDTVTLTATNGRYHRFLQWSDGNTNSVRTVTAGLTNNYVAIFTNSVPLETLAFKQWDRSFGGVEFDSYPTVRHTPDGGYVLAGSTTSGADGNKSTPLCGTTAAWVVKLDADGNKQWEQTVGAPGDSLYIVTLELTGDGGYVLGASSAADAGTMTNNCGKTSPNFGLADFWLVRLDASGQRLWDASFGGDNVDGLGAIAVLDDGGFILAGTSSSGATGNKASPHHGNKDCWVVRVDANGNKLWDRSFGGIENENALAVTALADGGLLVTGNSSSGIEGNKTSPNHGLLDYWAIRLDAEGGKLWDRSYGGDSDDIGGWMAPMPGGGALLVGYSESSINGTKSAPNRGGADYWVVRIDADGNQLWDRSFGGDGAFDWAYNVQAAADGGAIIVGESDTDIDGNKTTAQIGNSDGWLVRLDPYGEKSTEVSLGGIEYDYLWSVDTAGADAFVLAGGSYSDVGGNKSAPLRGNEDFWVVKMAERTAPVGTPVILVNGQFHPGNSVSVIGLPQIQMQTTFSNGLIFYTLDGSTPDSNSIPYTAPSSLVQSAMVRSIAYSSDFAQSAEADPVAVSVQPCLVKPSGLVAWWPGDGSANDLNGTNHGVFQGNAAYAAGLVGQAFSFDGGSFVEIPHSPLLSFAPGSSMTVELWAYRTAAYLPYHIIGKRDGCSSGVEWNYMIGIDGSVPDTPLNTWIHWTLVYGASDTSLFTNGVLYQSYAGYPLGPENTVSLTIGTAATCSSFTGLIDEIRIYNRALSSNEIAALFAAGSAGLCKPSPLTIGVLGGGGVARSPDKPRYDYGESVTLTATNRPYYTFLRWSDNVTSASRIISSGTINNLVAVFTNTVPLEEQAFPLWERSYGGGGTDLIGAIQPMPAGGFLVGGTSYSQPDGTKTAPLLGIDDFWVLRIDDLGGEVWDRTYGGPDEEFLSTITQAGANRWLVGGFSASPPGPDKTSPLHGEYDAWLVEVDGDGLKLSEATYGGPGRDQTRFLAVEGGGGFLGGQSASPAGGTKTSTNQGSFDFWLTRLFPDGGVAWDVSAGSTNIDRVHSGLVPTPDGGVLMAGYSPAGISGSKTVPGFGGDDAWIVRFGPDGTKLWERSYGGTNHDWIYDAALMPDGGFVLVGATYSGVSGNKTSPNFSEDSDVWVLRLDAEGNKVWDQTFGGTGYDYASRVTVTRDGGVLITGASDSPVSGNKTVPPIANVDVWLIRLDPFGNKTWERVLGGTDEEFSGTSVILEDGFITGNVSGSAPSGNKASPHHGEYDYWLVRFATREAPVGTPTILVNGQFSPANDFVVTNSAIVSIQTSFASGHIFYTLNGAPPGTGPAYSGPFAVDQAVTVRAMAYNNDYSQSAEADPVTITVETSPLITLQPEGAVAQVGTDVLFLVDAVGAAPLAYQWFFDGGLLGGATNSFLLRTNVQVTHAGAYWAEVSNRYGRATSLVATLLVVAPPEIISQPVGTNVPIGGSATFCVAASGSPPLSYQWRLNGVNIPDATNECYTATVSTGPLVGLMGGGSYTVVVQNGAEAVTSAAAVLGIEVSTPVSADSFAQRTLFDGSTIRGTNRFATKEAGEPDHAGNAGGRSIWYEWTPSFSANFRLRTAGSTFDTLLAVYTGTSVTNLTRVAEDDDSGGFHTSSVQFFANSGQTYVIAVDGFAGDGGEFVLSSVVLQGSIQGAEITGQPVGRTVEAGGDVTFSVSAANASSYRWYLNGLALSNANASTLTITNVQAVNVGAYQVVVQGHPTTASASSVPAVLEIGPFATLRSVDRVEELSTPFGSLRRFEPASGVPSVSIGSLGTQILNTTNSTTSLRETNHCGVIGGASRWFHLKAEANATFVLDTDGSGFDTVLAVYVSNPLLGGYLTLITCNDDASSLAQWSRVVFPATNGVEYRIVVDGGGGASGPVTLNWWLGSPPAPGPTTPPILNPTVREGTNLTLMTTLTNGVPSPRFQWYRNQTLLGNATNATFFVNNVQLVNAGTYSVVVSNAVGAITSIVARVTVDVPLNLGVITVTEDGRTHVRVSGTASRGFVIQGTTNFANWIPVHTNVTAGQPMDFEDHSATNRVRRFYRAQPWP